MNQSRVGVFCLRAKILGKCKGEGNKDRLALAKLVCRLHLCLGGVVGLKLAKFKLSPKLLFPCLVHIPWCYIKWVYGIDILFLIKNGYNVHLLVLLKGIFILCMGCNFGQLCP